MARQRQRLVPLTMAAALAEYRLAAAEELTDAERRDIAARRVAALSPEQRADLARRNQLLMDSAAIRLNASSIAVDGPARARLLVQDPPRRSTRKLPLTEAEMEQRRGW